MSNQSLEKLTAGLVAELKRQAEKSGYATGDYVTLLQVNRRFDTNQFGKSLLEAITWRGSRRAAAA